MKVVKDKKAMDLRFLMPLGKTEKKTGYRYLWSCGASGGDSGGRCSRDFL